MTRTKFTLSKISGFFLLTISAVYMLTSLNSCKKDEAVETQAISMKVLDPTGHPIGGATVYVKGKSESDPTFSGKSNADGIAYLKAPYGQVTLVAKMGSVFVNEYSLNVTKSTTDAGKVELKQNILLKVLVIKASAEQLEDVLDSLGYTDFDTISIAPFRNLCDSDPDSALRFLRQYTLVFSDCNGSEENQFSYSIGPVFKDYVKFGGKIYGGHYNYMNLRYIFPNTYMNDRSYMHDEDSITVIDPALSNFVGFSSSRWNSNPTVNDPVARRLNTYQTFDDLPNSLIPPITYLVVSHVEPKLPAVVENHYGAGKYVYTIYHNQDIIKDQKLLVLIKFFLFSM